MNYTQNRKIMSITERTLVVGVDIAKATHYTRAFDYRGIELDKVFKLEKAMGCGEREITYKCCYKEDDNGLFKCFYISK